MTTIINASPTNGLVQTVDGSGVLKVQSNGVTTNALAWVNFNGTNGSIRSSYNVSSVTRISTGYYTVTFNTALSDANYCAVASGGEPNTSLIAVETRSDFYATSSIRLQSTYVNGGLADATAMNLAVFGN